MNTADAVLRSWPAAPWLALGLGLLAVVYCVGWRRLRLRDSERWTAARVAAYLGGLATIYLALASPIESFAGLLLQAHMMQHLLLTMAAPPLLWLGAPLAPMLRGLPREVRTVWIAPLARNRGVRGLLRRLTHPAVALPLFVATTWFWHWPAMYEKGLASEFWHATQHASFLATAMIFWHPVIRPFPARPQWSRWWLLPYLLAADLQNTVLAAWLTFSSRVLYPHYESVPRIAGLTALADQSAAGVWMWVPGSLAFLVPLGAIAVRLVLGEPSRPAEARSRARPSHRSQGQTIARRASRWLAHIGWRRAAQAVLLMLAALVILDGLSGPQTAALNLAGVLPWIHWRGAVVLGLLAVGNVFCGVCPFTLPRSVLGDWLPEGRAWPAWLRNKWPAVGLLALFLWSYEAWSLWDSPWLTAWLAIGYFAGALLIDAVFRRGSFCKHVCPVGQFHFVHALLSPFEVRLRQPSVCASCSTHDCLRGGPLGKGCQMDLFQPRKRGNFDCTFCLDCVRACPQGNVGLLPVAPAAALASGDFARRLEGRADLAALVVVLAFGAIANAAGMVAPIVHLRDAIAQAFGSPRWIVATAFYAVVLVALPPALLALAGVGSRRLGGLPETATTLAMRFSAALIPLGFAMWLAHYGFHLATSYETVVPAAQRLAGDWGLASLGAPDWQCACCKPPADWLLRAELVALGVGLLVALYVALRIAESTTRLSASAWKLFLPWGLLLTVLFAACVWIVLQPMEMRGTLGMAE